MTHAGDIRHTVCWQHKEKYCIAIEGREGIWLPLVYFSLYGNDVWILEKNSGAMEYLIICTRDPGKLVILAESHENIRHYILNGGIIADVVMNGDNEIEKIEIVPKHPVDNPGESRRWLER